MKAWPLLLLLALVLAGCSQKPHELDGYLMRSSDVPGACYRIDPEDEDWRQLAGVAGWEENPGPVSRHILRLDGVTPTDTRFAFFECKYGDGFHQFISGVQVFDSPQEAAKWTAAAQAEQQPFLPARCHPQALVFAGGTIVGAIGSLEAWHPDIQSAANARFAQITAAPGVDDYCA